MLEGHGDDLYRFEKPILYNFSSNVYYNGTHPGLINHLKEQISAVTNYPSPNAQELSELAGKHLNLDSSQLLFTNGATEAFYLVSHLFRNQKAAVTVPSFAEYEDACKANDLNTKFVDIRSFLDYEFTENVVFLGNPNNPDGTVFSTEEIRMLLIQFPKTVFVVDEAYIEFTVSTKSCIQFVGDYDNLIIIRSLTKTFVIPGLRLGYIASSASNIKKLLQIKMPWSVNAIAINAGRYLLQHYSTLLFNPEHLIEQSSNFQKSLRTIQWLEVLPTHTNYFLMHLKKGTAAKLKNYLAEQHQILIRDATNFRGLEGEYIRLAVQSKKANEALVLALKQWNI